VSKLAQAIGGEALLEWGGVPARTIPSQTRLNPAKRMYEYAVLVTTAVVNEVLRVTQLCRDRGRREHL